jgi:hypothetical protein
MKCNTCGDYIAKAKKFNARKETVEGEDYLGLRIYRFYFKCPICMAEITFKTDPKNQDYELEHGATRNFQAYRLAEMQAAKEAADAEEEEKLNPMKMLENRTKASKREMQALEDLEELKELSSKTVNINTEEFLEREKERRKRYEEMILKQQQEEDEADLQALLEQQNRMLLIPGAKRTKWITLEGSDEQVEVTDDDEEEEEGDEKIVDEADKEEAAADEPPPDEKPEAKKSHLLSDPLQTRDKPLNQLKRKLGQMVRVVPKKKPEDPEVKSDPGKEGASGSGPHRAPVPSGLASLCNYSDSDEDDE